MKPCNQCGKCCINYSDGGLSATQDEIDIWEIQRPDIFAYVADGDIWISPVTGEPLRYCPWLKQQSGDIKYACAIYDHRPQDCRLYPVLMQDMIRDECEMLEHSDLVYPKGAQKKLDQIIKFSE